MRLLRRLRAYARVMPRGRRNRADLARYLVRRPLLMAAVGGYEAAVLFSNRVDQRVKLLAGIKASTRTGCPF